jgi:hypothetical protein
MYIKINVILLISIEVLCKVYKIVQGTKYSGDRLSRGTKLAGDQIGWGPNWLGTELAGDRLSRGTKLVGDRIGWGPFVQEDRIIGDQMWGTKCVRDQMSLSQQTIKIFHRGLETTRLRSSNTIRVSYETLVPIKKSVLSTRLNWPLRFAVSCPTWSTTPTVF